MGEQLSDGSRGRRKVYKRPSRDVFHANGKLAITMEIGTTAAPRFEGLPTLPNSWTFWAPQADWGLSLYL